MDVYFLKYFWQIFIVAAVVKINIVFITASQLTFTSSKSIIETLKKDVK